MKADQRYQTVTAGPLKPFRLSNDDFKPARKILTNGGKITGALLKISAACGNG